MTEKKEFEWIPGWKYDTFDGRKVACLAKMDAGRACIHDTNTDGLWIVDATGKSEFQSEFCDVVAGPDVPEDEDDLDQIDADCEEFDRLSKEVEAEREQWEYGHASGILDALESLLSFRENMQSDVLLAMIQKISKRKLFDPPF